MLADAGQVLDVLGTAAYAAMSPAELTEAGQQLGRLKARVAAHEMAVARAMEATSAARSLGATSTGDLLAGGFGGDASAGRRVVHQAKRLEKASATQEALARGDISLAQAELIARTLAALPASVTAADREACETQLLDDATRLSLKDLSRRADRISDVFAPDDADERENEIIEGREEAARRSSYFWMADRGDGTCKGGFEIPEAQGAMLKHALDAINAPQVKPAETAQDAVHDEPRTHGQQMADAFCALIENIDGEGLPNTAGTGATMTVNVDLEVLRGKIAAATLSDGTRISAGQARRMACTLGLLPMVFNGSSVPVDHGRTKRLFTAGQRRALEARDRGCTYPGCDRPPSWTVVHHARERWADGGTTDLADGVLICPAHHRYVHAHDIEIVFAADGIPEYRPPGGALRRNARYRPDRTAA